MRLCRAVINALLPPGSAWSPEADGGFDQLLDGMAANAEVLRERLAGLAVLRDPFLTPILADLEREYGIIPDDTVPETIRRQRLNATITARNGDGSADYLQDRLQAAGFDLYVHVNNPAVDPGTFILFAGSAIMGNADAEFNGENIQFGSKRGELIVNGPVYYEQALVRYAIPTDPTQWPLVFFVGGPATRDDTGALIDIADGAVPVYRRAELVRLIVRYKPMHTFAGLVARYT